MTIGTTITWSELVALEPQLAVLHAEIREVKDDKRKPGFCANFRWYGYGAYQAHGFKERLVKLAGYSAARHDEPRLRTPQAYDCAYKKLYMALPDCRNCGCVAMADFIG